MIEKCSGKYGKYKENSETTLKNLLKCLLRIEDQRQGRRMITNRYTEFSKADRYEIGRPQKIKGYVCRLLGNDK